jgi:hypothetical protein
MTPNPAVAPVRLARWTLRDEAAQRRLCQRLGVKSDAFISGCDTGKGGEFRLGS